MKRTNLSEKKRTGLEWYKWLLIIGVIWGIKSYLGLLLALTGALIWLYKKGFNQASLTKKLVITITVGIFLLILWRVVQ